MSRVLQAAQARYPLCPRCQASRGDPCRTPSDKTCAPHRERIRAWQATRDAENYIADAPCNLCEKGFPVIEGSRLHYGTQSLGMIPTTACKKWKCPPMVKP
jgi:hypothetical protein